MIVITKFWKKTAVALAAATVLAVPAPAARAVEPSTVAAAAQAAYGAYQAYKNGQLTLQQATDRILDAIEAAKTAIIAHIDRIAAADARACSKSAVIEFEDIEVLTPGNVQILAMNMTSCLTKVDSLLEAVADKGAVDQLGFALHALGPVTLMTRARAGMSTSGVRTTLIGANNTVISRLRPSCQATPLWGDAEPGGVVEVQLRCRAYNGDIGMDWVFTRNPNGQVYDFTYASNRATRNTSRALAQAVRPLL